MGFNLAQIINKFLPVKIESSESKFSQSITATVAEQDLVIPFVTQQILISNDGTDDLLFAFDGNRSRIYGYLSSNIIYTGTWTNQNFGTGLGNGKFTDNSVLTSNAVFKPSIPGLSSLAWNFFKGAFGGIAKIELSSDDGATWQKPSSINGVTRSDGVAGTAMDTVDQYSLNTAVQSLSFNLPTSSNRTWAMRIGTTNTKNTSAGGNNLYTGGFSIAPQGTIFTLKSKENLVLEIQTARINFSSPSSTAGRVVAI
jgi:hypothetical protein